MGSGYLDPFFRTLVKPGLGLGGNCGRRERHCLLVSPTNIPIHPQRPCLRYIINNKVRPKDPMGSFWQGESNGPGRIPAVVLRLEGAKSSTVGVP